MTCYLIVGKFKYLPTYQPTSTSRLYYKQVKIYNSTATATRTMGTFKDTQRCRKYRYTIVGLLCGKVKRKK